MKDEKYTREVSYFIRRVEGSVRGPADPVAPVRQRDTCGILGSIEEEEKKDESSSGRDFDGSRLKPQRPRLPFVKSEV